MSANFEDNYETLDIQVKGNKLELHNLYLTTEEANRMLKKDKEVLAWK